MKSICMRPGHCLKRRGFEGHNALPQKWLSHELPRSIRLTFSWRDGDVAAGSTCLCCCTYFVLSCAGTGRV